MCRATLLQQAVGRRGIGAPGPTLPLCQLSQRHFQALRRQKEQLQIAIINRGIVPVSVASSDRQDSVSIMSTTYRLRAARNSSESKTTPRRRPGRWCQYQRAPLSQCVVPQSARLQTNTRGIGWSQTYHHDDHHLGSGNEEAMQFQKNRAPITSGTCLHSFEPHQRILCAYAIQSLQQHLRTCELHRAFLLCFLFPSCLPDVMTVLC